MPLVEALGAAEIIILGPYGGTALLGTTADIGLTGIGLGAGGLVLGKMNPGGTLRDGTLGPGEYTLDLPDQGSFQGNWEQNASKLRFEMSKGNPIRDASAGKPGSESGFLRAERNLLRDHGWTQQGDHWYPPNK